MEHDHTNRALVVIMIIILIIILILMFVPRGTMYFTSPTVTVQRSVPTQTMVVSPTIQTHTYTTSTPISSYQQQTTTTTERTTTSSQ